MSRVAAILLAKQAGLADIRATIAAGSGPARRALLREHRDAVAARIEQMQAAYDLLDHGVQCQADDVSACPHFNNRVAAIADRLGTGSGTGRGRRAAAGPSTLSGSSPRR